MTRMLITPSSASVGIGAPPATARTKASSWKSKVGVRSSVSTARPAAVAISMRLPFCGTRGLSTSSAPSSPTTWTQAVYHVPGIMPVLMWAGTSPGNRRSASMPTSTCPRTVSALAESTSGSARKMWRRKCSG